MFFLGKESLGALRFPLHSPLGNVVHSHTLRQSPPDSRRSESPSFKPAFPSSCLTPLSELSEKPDPPLCSFPSHSDSKDGSYLSLNRPAIADPAFSSNPSGAVSANSQRCHLCPLSPSPSPFSHQHSTSTDPNLGLDCYNGSLIYLFTFCRLPLQSVLLSERLRWNCC